LHTVEEEFSGGGILMKITPTSNVSPQEKAEGVKRPTKANGEFARVFQDELNHATSAGQAVAPLEPGVALSSTTLMPPFALERVRVLTPAKVEHAIEATIEGLDKVGELLGDTSVTPRRVDAAIRGLSTQAEERQGAIKQLPPEHPLQRIATEVSVLATVESIKWERGDYL
jgi:hypothetical protein